MKAVPQSQPPRAVTISTFPLFHLSTLHFFSKQTPFVPFLLPEHWQHGEKEARSRMFQFYTTDFLLYAADFLFQRSTSKGKLVTKILGCNRHLMFYTALNPSVFTDIMIEQLSIVCSFFSVITPCLTVSIPSLKVLFFHGILLVLSKFKTN